ncbi:MAG: hypothetical protein KY466_04995 [Gemmatimonadetes bacterium]|nr:hypothetical protein [Gemmatimonadota bacterium]
MSRRFDAFHLPAPTDGPWRSVRAGALDCRYPEPTPALLDECARRLLAAGERLRQQPAGAIVTSVGRAAARLADPRDPLRVEAEALLPDATGYSPPMIRLILDRMTAEWSRDELTRLLEVELGGAAPLDGFAPRSSGTSATALGPRLAFHVFSGNVPGVAVTSLVRALLVKAPSFGKLAAGEPVLPVLFARALSAVDPLLGDAVAVTYWPGGEPEPERVLVSAADTLVVYGGEDAVAALRSRSRPDQRLVVHGPRISIGAIGSGPLEGGLEGTARRAARAVATFDQQGCVSPHWIWVEGSDQRAGELAAAMAASLATLEAELPRGSLTAAESSAIQQARGAAEMRAHGDPRVRVHAGAGTTWTVVLEPAGDLQPSCLNRFVRVHPLDDFRRLPELLAPLRGHLQSVALEGAGPLDADLARDLARAGASRVTTFEHLPWPSGHSHHDGSAPLRELLRWTDRER